MSEEPNETTGLLSGDNASAGGRSRGSRGSRGSRNSRASRLPPAAAPGSETATTVKRKKKKKKKKKGIVLNKDSAMELEYQVQVNLILHNLAAQYFTSRHLMIFTIPQAVLTMLVSILAFLSSSELLNPFQKTLLATIVGSTSGVVVFLQTMSGVCSYGTRGAQHYNAAIDLRDLRDHIILIKFKLQRDEEELDLEKKRADIEHEADEDEAPISTMLGPSDAKSIASYPSNDSERSQISIQKSKAGSKDGPNEKTPNDSDDSDDEEDLAEDDNVFARLQQRYRQSLAGCKSNVPMQLSEAFHGMNSNLLVMDSMDQKRYMANIYGPKVKYSNLIHFKAYDILAEEILLYWAFPISLPAPRYVVKRAMDELEERLDESHSHWDVKERELKRLMVKQDEEDAALMKNTTGRMSTIWASNV